MAGSTRIIATGCTKLPGHSTRVIAADWSGDSRLVSAAWKDPTVRVWDIETAQTVQAIEIAADVDLVRLFPTGDRLAAAFDDRTVRVYELATGATIAVARQTGNAFALIVSPDASRVICAGFGDDKTVLWSWIPGQDPEPLARDIFFFDMRSCLWLSQDGTQLWCFFEWDLLELDARTGAEVARFEGDRSENFGKGFVLSSERCAVAVVSFLNHDDEPIWPCLRKWNVESREVLWQSPVGRRGPLAVARNERWFALADWNAVVFYSTRSGEVLGVLSLERPKARISRLSLSPNNRRLALGTSDGEVIVYDLGDFSLEAP